MLSHNLPVKILPQQNETYRTPFSFEGQNIFTREGETQNYYLNISGTEISGSSYCISDYLEVEPSKRYVMSFARKYMSTAIYLGWYDSTKALIHTDVWIQECFVSPSNAKYVRLSYLKNFPATDMHIEVGTIANGTLNVKTGVLMVDKGYISDLNQYLFSKNSAYTSIFVTQQVSNARNSLDTTDRNKGYITSAFSASRTTGVNNSMDDGSMLLIGASNVTNGYFVIRSTEYDNDLSGFRESLVGVQVVYPYAEPVIYQLAPQEVRTLLGNNKISSNATELRLTYLNDNNETIALTGDNEYIIDDGVFNRSPSTVNQIFEPKQDLHGYDYPWPPGGGGNLMNIGDIELLKDPDLVHINSTRTGFYGTDEDLVEMFNGGEWGYIPILGQDTLNPVGIEYDTPYTLYFRAYTDGEESTSGTGLEVVFYEENGTRMSSMRLRNSYTSEREFSYTTFNPDRGEPGYTLGGIAIEGGSGLCGNTWHFEFMSLAEGTSYLPYSNICPIEGYTESVLTVEGDRISDSESERRLKTITRPVFQWDTGLKLKFEGCTFADGTLCQFDNKLTTFSQNEYIVNNECIIPASLLDENCQGDIVAYINVSGNNYDVVVYEVYIPVIKRPKPENFLRPAIDLPSAVIASFSDGADDVPLERLKIAVTPKQDLHGYDYPWVGGGGKNKINLLDSDQHTITNYYAELTVNNGSISSYKIKESTTFTVSFTVESSVEPFNISIGRGNGTYSRDIKTVSNLTNGRVSVTTSISDLSDGRDILAIRCVRFSQSQTFTYRITNMQVEEAFHATAYEPYENICPITGYTEANVTRTGKNLFDLNYLTAENITIADGVASGTAMNFYLNFRKNGNHIPIPFDFHGKYTWSLDAYTDGNEKTTGWGLYFTMYYTDGTNTYVRLPNSQTSYSHVSVTNPENKEISMLCISYSDGSSNIWHIKNIQLQSEAQTDPEDEYEPYAGHGYNIPFTHEGPNVFTTEGSTLDRYINGNGQESTSSNYRITAYIPVEPNKRYVYDANNARFSTSVYHAYYDANKQFITSVHAMQEGFYIPSNVYYVRLSYRKDEVPTDFHISIGTVPHGTLDIKTGILTQDYAFVSDMSNMYWRVNSTTYPTVYRTDHNLGNIYRPTTATGRTQGFSCSCYKPMDEDHAGSGSNSTPYAMMRYNGGFFIRNDDYNNDAASFKASLEGQQVVYELDRESPAIYQLTPTEVKTLLGYNNIWADTGEVEVLYYPDPYLHFES